MSDRDDPLRCRRRDDDLGPVGARADAAIAVVAQLLRQPLLVGVCAIWAAHIAFDRFLGYGLIYGTGFKDTHLSRL